MFYFYPNEVAYLSQTAGLGAYELNIIRSDSSFGWTANASELAKYKGIIDRNPGVQDLITTEVLNQIYFGANWGALGYTSGKDFNIFGPSSKFEGSGFCKRMSNPNGRLVNVQE